MKNKENIAALAIFVALFGHVYAYIEWGNWKGINIYYITLYFLFYVFSIVVLMFSHKFFLKLVGSLALTISSYLLFLEFTADPSNWTIYNKVSGLLSILTSAIIIFIIEKLK